MFQYRMLVGMAKSGLCALRDEATKALEEANGRLKDELKARLAQNEGTGDGSEGRQGTTAGTQAKEVDRERMIYARKSFIFIRSED